MQASLHKREFLRYVTCLNVGLKTDLLLQLLQPMLPVPQDLYNHSGDYTGLVYNCGGSKRVIGTPRPPLANR